MADQRYEITISAAGVVRDINGNVISTPLLESKVVLTEDELRALTEGEQA